MPFGLLTRFDPGKHVLRGGPDPSYERDDFAVFLPSKCIRLCKQQRSQQHGAAKMSTGAARHGENAASELTQASRCGLSSKFFGRLLNVQ